ncbi:SOS response-associated peptidase [Inquilinus sp. Marseille-Q2685]|uniref:SOS response-associated peptidase n=1 Tax=Inquilinus sp. Marseille-Q2685 TaxID=2866581 RepID=UPI001CE4874F|nr:SOS response-associated peptidase [Inquilinus sp. Marseille-Q2685]
MCGRFVQKLPPEELVETFGADGPVPNVPARYNAAPTQDLAVVRFNPKTGRRAIDLLRWGLVPNGEKDLKGGAKLINARSETLAERRSFAKAFQARRCLVPADGFYEWAPDRTPHFVRRLDGRPMVFAGLWEGWKDPESGEWTRTFTIVTADAVERLRPIHHRMPVMLEPERWPAWLGEETASPAQLQAMLAPPADLPVEAYPVSTRVNAVRNDDPTLMDRTGHHDPAMNAASSAASPGSAISRGTLF